MKFTTSSHHFDVILNQHIHLVTIFSIIFKDKSFTENWLPECQPHLSSQQVHAVDCSWRIGTGMRRASHETDPPPIPDWSLPQRSPEQER